MPKSLTGNGQTPMVAIRVDPTVWAQAKRIAANKGETMSEVVRRSVASYVKRNADKHDHP